jgi:sugar/nucleoside kinase (ribokinase family)
MKKGITIAGNLIVDYVKEIDIFPEEGLLSNILSLSRSVGGCAANTAADLAVMDEALHVCAIGCVGDDENGEYVINCLNTFGVDTQHIYKVGAPTSFTDVMSVVKGQRTFFHARGANAHFETIPESALNCNILHMGYALLLEKMDAPYADYGTKMAFELAKARSKGVKTSLDVVSEAGERFQEIVLPSLPHCDYIIINEIEASLITGIRLRENNIIIDSNMPIALQKLLTAGVHELAVIHSPEGGWAMDIGRRTAFQPSLCLPEGSIMGTVGAGDAFCAGMLYGLYQGYELNKSLQFAVAAAACSLSAPDSVSGMKNAEAIWEVYHAYMKT